MRFKTYYEVLQRGIKNVLSPGFLTAETLFKALELK